MLPPSSAALRATALLTLPAVILAATSFDCSDLVQDNIHFNLKELGGPFVVNNIIDDGISKTNQTFTIDLCRPLKKLSKLEAKYQCPSGTRVCLQDYVTRSGDDKTAIEKVVPIAGDYIHEGRGWNPTWQRLSQSDSHGDAGKEGLRIVFDGGKYPFEDKKNFTSQKAIVELVCDPSRTGLEGDEQDKRPTDDERRKRDDPPEKDDGGDAEAPKGPSLKFVSYETTDVGTLRLEWRTKHACERDTGNDGGSGGSKSGSWGFFTWFLIILFLAISAYLIFGSWLNYNRYGARGWDLLPHGDTIRDIPYLVKDWGRKVVNTVQGGGSRGGYSAV